MDRILILEDLDADYRLLLRHLKQQGVGAVCERVSAAHELDAALANGPWSLVLTDYLMPGFEFRQLLALLQVRLPGVPVILVSGNIGEEAAVDLLREGLSDFVLKDRLARLVPAMQRSLDERAQRQRASDIALALSDSEGWSRTLLASLADGLFVAQNRQFVFANPALPLMLGHAHASFVGLPFERVVAPDFLAQWTNRFIERNADHQVDRPETPDQCDVQFLTASGQRLWIELRASRFQYHGRAAVLGLVRDVTERKRIAAELEQHRHHLEALVEERTHKAEAANRAKSAFLANISHEIRTPMNAIMGMTHMLRRDLSDALSQERLTTVNDAAQHLLGIINDVLDLSKIESGKLQLEDIDFGLDALLARTCELVAGRARDKGIELVLDNTHPEEVLRGDPTRLSQALLNLLSNAVKFTADGVVMLSCRFEASDGGPPLLRFEVRDTGIGIAPDRLRQLFSAFEQADSSTTRRFGGTGLGLAITRHLAELMGGDVGAHSQEGEGSVFWLTAKLRQSAAAPRLVRNAGLAGLRALVVDARPEPRQAIAGALRLIGLRPDAVAGAEQALATLRNADQRGTPFALALIDQGLRECSGVALVQQIMALGLQRPPQCVLMAVQCDAALRSVAAAAGAVQVIEKPLHCAALQSLLGTLLDRHQEPPAHPGESAAERMLRSRFSGASVLLAEDNPVNQMVAVELLRAVGLEVDVADDGPSAIALASRRRHDLILLDVQMPEIDGLQACRAIRALPDRAQVPILAMTANAFSEDRAACLAAGMDDHVPKPVEPQRLYEALLHWLSARESSAGAAAPAAVADPSAAPPELAALDSVAGLDWQAGLRHFGGRSASYLRGLQRFASVYGEGLLLTAQPAPDAAPDAAPDTARDQLLRHMHSMRGAAGTIGAASLQAQAARIEALLHGGRPQPQIDDALQSLRDELTRLTQQLRQAAPSEAQTM